MKVEGRVIKLGDKIDTDLIIPAKYLKYTDPQYLAQHVLEPLDPEFSKKAAEGIILVVGKLFGTGSSREQAAIALKAAGVKAVLAESFSRIFYRNAINNGLPVLVCQGISNVVNNGDYVVLDLESSEVVIQGRDVRMKCRELPDIVLRILGAGGLIEYLRTLKK